MNQITQINCRQTVSASKMSSVNGYFIYEIPLVTLKRIEKISSKITQRSLQFQLTDEPMRRAYFPHQKNNLLDNRIFLFFLKVVAVIIV